MEVAPMGSKKATPWNCFLPDCTYARDNSSGRAGHLKLTHGLDWSSGMNDDDIKERLAGNGSADLGEDPPAWASELITAVKALAPATKPNGSSPLGDDWTVDQVVKHCEGGTCAVHSQQFLDMKTKILESALANIPEEVVKQKAEDLNLIPKKIIIEGVPMR